MGRNNYDKHNWSKTSATTWEAGPNKSDDYTGEIEYLAGTGYTLTITGPDAPAPTAYTTRGNAKSAYRMFLLDKS
jgi:hypothetical protein